MILTDFVHPATGRIAESKSTLNKSSWRDQVGDHRLKQMHTIPSGGTFRRNISNVNGFYYGFNQKYGFLP